MRQKINDDGKRIYVSPKNYRMFVNGLFNYRMPHDYNYALGYAMKPLKRRELPGEQEIKMARINNKLIIQ